MSRNMGATAPTLIYVHGVGGPRKKAIQTLLKRLAKENPSIVVDPQALVTVNYRKIVRRKGRDDEKSDRLKRSTINTLDHLQSEHERVTRDLAKTMKRYASDNESWRGKVPEKLASHAARVSRKRMLKEAQRYRRRRHQVRRALLTEFDRAGAADMIVVAHSLGTVAMVDLLPHLGAHRHIRLLVTLGSPLGFKRVWKRTRKGVARSFPYESVSAWVNIWSETDHVTGYRGISRRFPQAVDVQIAFRKRMLDTKSSATILRRTNRKFTRHHALGSYVSHPATAKAIAWAWQRADSAS